MPSDLTDVTVILDRSGSMELCREEAQNGVNHFVEEQQKEPGECLFSLVQFDSEYEFVRKGVPIADVREFKLVPRGMTALLDAVGRAINETGERLAAMNEDDRPGLVVFVIVTDGQENASHEFTKAQVKEMIERQQKDYQWQFTFLGANQDAFAEAGAIGIRAGATANFNAKCAQAGFDSASVCLSGMRQMSALGKQVDCAYTEGQRGAMLGR